MKRIFMLLTLILALMCPALAGAEVSSDKMILDWTTSKVWVNGGELCVTGTFVNKRNDVAITKLNEFIMRVTYTDKNGERKQFLGRPVKFPMCKIPAKASRKLNLNFGPFADDYTVPIVLDSQKEGFSKVLTLKKGGFLNP